MWWLALGTATALAQSTALDPLTATDLGAGGVLYANPGAPGAAIVAPAVLALSPRYQIVAGGRLGTSHVRRIELAATDSSTGPITLGAFAAREGFTRDATVSELPGWLEPDDDISNPQTHTLLGGGLALSMLNRQLALGAGVRYQQYTSRFTDLTRDWQATASLAARPAKGVYLGLSAEELLPQDAQVDPRIALAARWEEGRRAALEADLLTRLDGLEAVVLGAEVWASETVPLRVGYRRALGDAPTDTLTAGLSVASDQAALDYGAQLTLGSLEHTHGLSLRIFL